MYYSNEKTTFFYSEMKRSPKTHRKKKFSHMFVYFFHNKSDLLLKLSNNENFQTEKNRILRYQIKVNFIESMIWYLMM